MNGQKIMLRKQPPAAKETPPGVKTVNTAGFRGTLPFKPASVTGGDGGKLSEALKEEATAIFAEQDKEAEKQRAKAVKPQEPVDLDTLSEAKQQEILSAIQDTLTLPKTRTPLPTPPPAVPEPVQEPESVPPITPPSANLASTCEHCGWPVGKCDNTNPDQLDKQSFVASILGQQRFYKTYKLLGGEMHLTFRSLTTEEMDMVVKQLVNDWNDGKISGPAHSVAEATKYQMALGLHSVGTNAGPKDVPMLSDFAFDKTAKETPLPEILEYVHTNALPNESLRRIASKSYGHFLDTLSKLEAMAEHADFWEAIGG